MLSIIIPVAICYSPSLKGIVLSGRIIQNEILRVCIITTYIRSTQSSTIIVIMNAVIVSIPDRIEIDFFSIRHCQIRELASYSIVTSSTVNSGIPVCLSISRICRCFFIAAIDSNFIGYNLAGKNLSIFSCQNLSIFSCPTYTLCCVGMIGNCIGEGLPCSVKIYHVLITIKLCILSQSICIKFCNRRH